MNSPVDELEIEVLTIRIVKGAGQYTACLEARRPHDTSSYKTRYWPFKSAVAALKGCTDRIEAFGNPRGRGRPQRGYWVMRSLQ